jgi:hypothetical protein
MHAWPTFFLCLRIKTTTSKIPQHISTPCKHHMLTTYPDRNPAWKDRQAKQTLKKGAKNMMENF